MRCLLLAVAPAYLNLVEILLTVASMLFLSNDRWGYRLFATGLQFLIMFTTEILANWLFTAMGLRMDVTPGSGLLTDMGAYLTVRAISLMVIGFLLYLSVVLWRLLIRRSAQKTLLSFALFPFSQAILCLFACGMVTSAGGKQADYLELLLLMLLSLVADIVMLWGAIKRLR